jgi:hypothetical protein
MGPRVSNDTMRRNIIKIAAINESLRNEGFMRDLQPHFQGGSQKGP